MLISAVVVWDVAIKRSLGKLDAPEGLGPTLLEAGAQPLVGLVRPSFDLAAAQVIVRMAIVAQRDASGVDAPIASG